MSYNKKIFATPIVRKFARELGADISKIQGTERKGRITENDVKKYINYELNNSQNNEKKEYKMMLNLITQILVK